MFPSVAYELVTFLVVAHVAEGHNRSHLFPWGHHKRSTYHHVPSAGLLSRTHGRLPPQEESKLWNGFQGQVETDSYFDAATP